MPERDSPSPRRPASGAAPEKRTKPAARKAPARTPAKATASSSSGRAAGAKRGQPNLLSGGNPQIAKGEGDAPVQAYIAAMPGWKRALGQQLDALVVRNVPGVHKAVKWNSPFYGIPGQGWLVSFHTFTNYVKVTFFQGASLEPPPPGGTSDDARWINVGEGELDEAQMSRWLQQAAALPGWLTADIRS